jgi:hypothetical protein
MDSQRLIEASEVRQRSGYLPLSIFCPFSAPPAVPDTAPCMHACVCFLPMQFPADKPPFLTACLYTCISWFAPVVPRVVPSVKGRKGKAEWLALVQSDPTLGAGGKPPRLDITMAEVRLHNKRTDAWMVFNGAVSL